MRQGAAPVALTPTFPLPAKAADGTLDGLEPGWAGLLVKAQATAMGVDVLSGSPIGPYRPRLGPLAMSTIVAAGPSTGLFVGVQQGLIRIDTPGQYSFSLRLQRNEYSAANCSSRLGMAETRVLSQYNIGMVGQTDITFEPVAFDMKPGLYQTVVAFGCWNDGTMVGTGRLTLMVRGPADQTLAPLRDEAILHAVTRRE